MMCFLFLGCSLVFCDFLVDLHQGEHCVTAACWGEACAVVVWGHDTGRVSSWSTSYVPSCQRVQNVQTRLTLSLDMDVSLWHITVAPNSSYRLEAVFSGTIHFIFWGMGLNFLFFYFVGVAYNFQCVRLNAYFKINSINYNVLFFFQFVLYLLHIPESSLFFQNNASSIHHDNDLYFVRTNN